MIPVLIHHVIGPVHLYIVRLIRILVFYCIFVFIFTNIVMTMLRILVMFRVSHIHYQQFDICAAQIECFLKFIF